MDMQEVLASFREACTQCDEHTLQVPDSAFDCSDLDAVWDNPFCEQVLLPYLLERPDHPLQLFPEVPFGSSEETDRQLSRLSDVDHRKSRLTGIGHLSAGYPLFAGTLPDGSHLCAPVFLFPLTLTHETLDSGLPGWSLSHRCRSHVQVNYSLVKAFEQHYGLHSSELDELFFIPPRQTGVLGVIEAVQNLFRQLDIPLFPDVTISKGIQPRQPVSEQQEGFCIQANLILDTFTHLPAFLYDQYSKMIDGSLSSSAVVQLLGREETHHPSSEELNGMDIDENRCSFITSLDSSQERAVQAVTYGGNLAIQGPPGSGITQVLVNIASDALARGKRVLMVSPVRADVISFHQRLQDNGLGSWCMSTTDPCRDGEEMLERINDRLKHPVEEHFDETESARLKTRFQELSHGIDKQLARLEQVLAVMDQPGTMGIALGRLYAMVSGDPSRVIEELMELPGSLGSLDEQELEELTALLHKLAPGLPSCCPDHLLFDRRSFSGADRESRDSWIGSVEAVRRQAEQFLAKGDPSLKAWALEHLVRNRGDATDDPSSRLSRLLDQTLAELENSRLLGPEDVGDPELLRGLLDAVGNSHAWKARFWKGIGRLKKLKGGEGIFAYSRRIRYTLNLLDRLKEIEALSGISIAYQQPHVLKDALVQLKESADGYIQLLDAYSHLEEFLLPERVGELFAMNISGSGSSVLGVLSSLQDHLDEQFDAVSEADRVLEEVPEHWTTAISALLRHCSYDIAQVVQEGGSILKNTAYLLQIREIESRHPEVSGIPEEIDEYISSVNNQMEEKRLLVRRLISRRWNTRIADMMDKSWQPGELVHDLQDTKTNPIAGRYVKRYLTEGLQEFFPCWAMGIDAALEMLPCLQAFDLVLVDGASHLSEAELIPLVLRGEHAVVAGHPSRIEDNNALDLAAGCFSAMNLGWQYRQRSSLLSTFASNRWYSGTMKFIPVPQEPETPFRVIPVDDVCEFLSGHQGDYDGVIAASEAVLPVESSRAYLQWELPGLSWSRVLAALGSFEDIKSGDHGEELLSTLVFAAENSLDLVVPQEASLHMHEGLKALLACAENPSGCTDQSELPKIIAQLAELLSKRGFSPVIGFGCSACPIPLVLLRDEQGGRNTVVLPRPGPGKAREVLLHQRNLLIQRGWQVFLFWEYQWHYDRERMIQDLIAFHAGTD